MSVDGSLAFRSGTQYIVFLNASTSWRANVSGTAELAGNVLANVLSASNMTYLILDSTGLNGARFGGLVVSNPNFGGMLTYTADDVFCRCSCRSRERAARQV